MSATSKARLQTVMTALDGLFAGSHPDDRDDLIKELRDYLSRQKSAVAAPGYGKHTNAATGAH